MNTNRTPHSDSVGAGGPRAGDIGHFVKGVALRAPLSDASREAVFGMGCFWGSEKLFWQRQGVQVTAVGYAGGGSVDPNYAEVCRGDSGHVEVTRVVFDPGQVGYGDLLRMFWEGHDPTQGMRQGNDIGTQYRSVIYLCDESQRQLAIASRDIYGRVLSEAGYGDITTTIEPLPTFYYAEDYHQQYLAKNPAGYCGSGGTGLKCPPLPG